MSELTVRHCERGVKAIEYGVVGDVLFWCIKTCVGNAAFTKQVEVAWVKIYSKMLQVIVPVAVAHERAGKYLSSTIRQKYSTVSDKITAETVTSTKT